MISIAWAISIAIALYVGYKFQQLERLIKRVHDRIEERQEKKQETESPSEFLDPDDLQQQIRQEHKRKIQELNPDYDLDDLL